MQILGRRRVCLILHHRSCAGNTRWATRASTPLRWECWWREVPAWWAGPSSTSSSRKEEPRREKNGYSFLPKMPIFCIAATPLYCHFFLHFLFFTLLNDFTAVLCLRVVSPQERGGDAGGVWEAPADPRHPPRSHGRRPFQKYEVQSGFLGIYCAVRSISCISMPLNKKRHFENFNNA